MSDDNRQQNLATQIKSYHKSGEFDKALEISKRVLESDPPDLEAYHSRWRLIAETFSEADAKKRILPEIESLLRKHPETPELLNTAYWGYMELPGREKNIPSSLFDKILQYPRTEVYQAALLGLAERSEDVHQKWHYYQRIIDEFTDSDAPILSWYWLAYEQLLSLAERIVLWQAMTSLMNLLTDVWKLISLIAKRHSSGSVGLIPQRLNID